MDLPAARRRDRRLGGRGPDALRIRCVRRQPIPGSPPRRPPRQRTRGPGSALCCRRRLRGSASRQLSDGRHPGSPQSLVSRGHQFLRPVRGWPAAGGRPGGPRLPRRKLRSPFRETGPRHLGGPEKVHGLFGRDGTAATTLVCHGRLAAPRDHRPRKGDSEMKFPADRLLAALLLAALPAFAQTPPSLAQSNPFAHQTLSAPDYLRFVPCPDPLTGILVPAYSGTSELFLKGVLEQLAKIHPGLTWDPRSQFTSSAGVIAMMLSGEADLGLSSIPMTSAQREAFTRRFGYPVLEARVALDALQILVHPSNPIDTLTVPQLDAIYGSELRAGARNRLRTWDEAGWPGGGDLHAYAGWLHYGTSKFFQETVLEGGPWREDLRDLPEVQIPERNLAGDPQAIAFSNYRPRDARVKVLAIARQTEEPPYPPLPAHIYGEEYPLVRFFTVYANAPAVEDLPAETREFLNYLLSYEGQTEVAKTGSLPLDRTMLLRARKRLGL
ncbi:MAG: hypothetical protein EOM72_06350 [Opitutae bacterium]|nr:hypothetical protein [Opitutae bacterium]